MNPDSILGALDAAIGGLEAALDLSDAGAVEAASATLAGALAPLRQTTGWGDSPDLAVQLSSALARVDRLRVRIAVVSDLDQRRAARGGATQTYGRRGNLRLVPAR